MSPRLPIPGGDDGTWGDVLNEYLGTEHNGDGTHKAIVNPDATTTSKGKIQLAGDLGGTAGAPTVPGLSSKADDANVLHKTGNETKSSGTTQFDGDVYLGSGRPWADVRAHGAVGDGVADDTQAFLDAISELLALPTGGTVFMPPGTYRITNEVLFPPASGIQSLDMQGSGIFASTLKMDGAAALVKFSVGGGGNLTGLWGGRTGNFRFDGINGAQTAMLVGLGAERTFHDIRVENGFVNGLVIEELQNSRFHNISVYRCTGDGIRLDYGAGGNTFYGIEVADCNIGINFAAGANGPYPGGPTDNKFFGGIVEYFLTGPVPTAHIHYGAGDQNYIFGMHIANSGTDPGQHTPAVRIPAGGGTNLHLYGIWAVGTGNNGIFLDASNDGFRTYIYDCAFADYDCLWKLSDNHTVEIGTYTSQNVTQRFRNQPGGGNFEENLVRQRVNHPTERNVAGVNQNIEVVAVAGETGLRFRRVGGGTFVWGPGSEFSGDTTLYRGGANQLTTDDRFVATDGITTKTKAGVPTDGDFASTPENGTMVIDTTNSRIYVRIGGTWKSVNLA